MGPLDSLDLSQKLFGCFVIAGAPAFDGGHEVDVVEAAFLELSVELQGDVHPSAAGFQFSPQRFAPPDLI